MKKLFLTTLLFSCSLFAQLNTIVSIAPEATFTKTIGGDKIELHTMVQAGNSPHTYEPKPSQMRAVSSADIYFAIGVEFERAWLPRFKAQNSKMEIVDVTKGIKKLPMSAHHHHEKEHHDDKDKEHNQEEHLDPHVWLAPSNVKVIATNIYNALVAKDPKNSDHYRLGYEKLLKEIEATDRKIKTILSSIKPGTKFMVFHPSWGYFAKEYNLVQIPIELEGKEPKPRELVRLIQEAKAEHIQAIFTAPEFSDKIAKEIAKELKIPVIKITPLAANWSQNLLQLAKAIAHKK